MHHLQSSCVYHCLLTAGVLLLFENADKVEYKAFIILFYSWPSFVQVLDELLLHHTIECGVRQVWHEGIAGLPTDAFTASQVQQSQRGETLQVGQADIRQLTTTWLDRQTGLWLRWSIQTITESNGFVPSLWPKLDWSNETFSWLQ